MQKAKEAVAVSMAAQKCAKKIGRGKPSRMILRWLEAENGNVSEDSTKIIT